MNEINQVALFRLSVLGPLVSPEQLQRGALMATSNSPTFGQSNSPRQDG